MKKLCLILSCALMMSTCVAKAAENEKEITVKIDGISLKFADRTPLIVDGRVLVPMRAVFETLGAEITWDGEERSVTAKGENTSVKLKIGESTYTVNDEARDLEVPARIIDTGL